jgi:DNA-binding response OmpR family regulator
MQRQRTILVVDDEPEIRDVIRAYLERDGFRVIGVGDGEAALRLVRTDKPDALVLDLMLPGIGGMEVCRRVRAESDIPIMMLTARDDITDKVLGLELGADDYVTKPFDVREVAARVHALLRRPAGPAESAPGPLAVGDLKLDPTRREVSRAGQTVPLTRTEFDLLHALMHEPGRVFTREDLLDRLVDIERDTLPRSIDSHIRNLRRKLEPDTRNPRYVQTVTGVGYRFAPAP